jgi:hypothetical protein
VALIAVLILPLGMNAPAAAAAHHGPMAGMPMQHCPDQAPSHQPKGGMSECTMACASALPAMDRVRDEIPPMAHIALLPLPAHPLHGLHPDTATPPPKAT